MKRTVFYLMMLALSVIAFGLIACSDDEPEEPVRPPYMYAEQTLYEIDATAQTITVILNTNIAELDVFIPDKWSWIKLQKIHDSSEDIKTCIFQIAANSEGELREGSAAIVPKNVSGVAAPTITVRQSAAK